MLKNKIALFLAFLLGLVASKEYIKTTPPSKKEEEPLEDELQALEALLASLIKEAEAKDRELKELREACEKLEKELEKELEEEEEERKLRAFHDIAEIWESEDYEED